MEAELVVKQLVKKGDLLMKDNGDETFSPYEVIMADEEFFCLAPITYDNERNETSTNFEETAIYSNDSSINVLEELGFSKVN